MFDASGVENPAPRRRGGDAVLRLGPPCFTDRAIWYNILSQNEKSLQKWASMSYV